MGAPRALLLTFDVEEFDLPGDLGHRFSDRLAFQVAERGARRLERLCRDGLRATCFVTASFAHRRPALVRALQGAGCEIACHGALHRRRYGSLSPRELEQQLRRARLELEQLCGVPVLGHRSPRFMAVPAALLRRAGFCYDSSLHPTWVPGRYNHLGHPLTPQRGASLVRLPVSVVPGLRLPLSWIWFRNLPLPLLRLGGALAARRLDAVCVYFHNWEFCTLDRRGLHLPRAVARGTGRPLRRRLEAWVAAMRRLGLRDRPVAGYLAHRYPGALRPGPLRSAG